MGWFDDGPNQIWRVSARNGWKVLEDDWYHPVYEEENSSPWHPVGYVRRDRGVEDDPPDLDSARLIVIGMCGLRESLTFDIDTAPGVITLRLGTRGPAYRIERIKDASEVMW